MLKTIKSYKEYGTECGVAQQVEGKTVDAELGSDGYRHFTIRLPTENGGEKHEKWVASNFAFVEE